MRFRCLLPDFCSLILVSLLVERRMMIAFPPEITRRFVNRLRDIAEVRRDVVLESFTADELQQLLQLRNLRHARPAERLQRRGRRGVRYRVRRNCARDGRVDRKFAG